MRTLAQSAAVMAVMLLVISGCQTTPKTEAKKDTLVEDSRAAVDRMQREDPALRDMMSNAYGYVVFPSVGKGGVIVGGAYGKGVVHDHGRLVGYADLTQASIGAQLGGQAFSELILFQNQAALDRFKSNEFAFAANASAVAIKSGAAAAAKYENGVAVFTQPTGGLMFEASVGGQKFTYQSAADADRAMSTTRTGETVTTETKTETKTNP